MTSSPLVSVVIPAYNEEKRLVSTLERIDAHCRAAGRPYELIVVNDGSTDRTADAAREWKPADSPLFVIDRGRNRGKGFSVREGVDRARGDWIFFSDADLSTPIEEMEKFLARLESGVEVVIGSRNLPESRLEVKQPWYRRIMGKVFNLLVRLLAVPGVRDTQCGFKAFSRRAAEMIFSRARIDGFSFDVEILYLARKLRLKIEEVPVCWIDSPRSTVDPLRDSLRMFKDIARIRRDDRRGVYDLKPGEKAQEA